MSDTRSRRHLGWIAGTAGAGVLVAAGIGLEVQAHQPHPPAAAAVHPFSVTPTPSAHPGAAGSSTSRTAAGRRPTGTTRSTGTTRTAGGVKGSAQVTHRAAAPAPAVSHARRAGTGSPGVLANPDDRDGADKKAAYQGSTGVGTSKPTTQQRAYTSGHRGRPPATLPANRVLIPSIGVYASIVPERADRGFLKVPTAMNRIAWASMTPSLASRGGATMLAGHVSYNGVPGPFAKLAKVTAGAVVYTTTPSGHLTGWRVTGLRSQPKTANWRIPVTGARQLILVTCGGRLGHVTPAPGQSAYAHLDNIIVTATPVRVQS